MNKHEAMLLLAHNDELRKENKRLREALSKLLKSYRWMREEFTNLPYIQNTPEADAETLVSTQLPAPAGKEE